MECKKRAEWTFDAQIINVDSESVVCGMNKKREFCTVELGCAIMTEQSLWNTEKGRMEPG